MMFVSRSELHDLTAERWSISFWQGFAAGMRFDRNQLQDTALRDSGERFCGTGRWT